MLLLVFPFLNAHVAVHVFLSSRKLVIFLKICDGQTARTSDVTGCAIVICVFTAPELGTLPIFYEFKRRLNFACRNLLLDHPVLSYPLSFLKSILF